MEKKNKIIIIVSIIVILASITLSILMLTRKEEEPTFIIDGISLPENKDILKDSKVSTLDITGVSLITRDGLSTYKATLSNNTNEDMTINNLYVIFYINEEKHQILAIKNIKLISNNMTYIDITSEKDLTKTTKIEYVLE